MFTARGYVDSNVPYSVTVDAGRVTGSPRIDALLRDHEGETFAPEVREAATLTAERTDEAVYNALSSLTRLVEVTGDVPMLDDEDTPEGVKH